MASKSHPKLGEGLRQTQVLCTVGGCRLQGVELRLNPLSAFSDVWHTTAQLLERHQAFLICRHQTVKTRRQPGVFPSKGLLPLGDGIGSERGGPPALDLPLNEVRVVEHL
jgi:hypothetical protein